MAFDSTADQFDAELFAQCRTIPNCGSKKFTTGLFWVSPNGFLPLGGAMLEFLKARSVSWNNAQLLGDDGIQSLYAYRALIKSAHDVDYNHAALVKEAQEWTKQHPTPEVVPPETALPEFPLNTILYGPPGTGKTFSSVARAVAIIDGVAPADRAECMARYEELTKTKQIGFVTFHQTFSYEEFIEGLRPVIDDGAQGGARYAVRDGIFKEMALRALGACLEPIETIEPGAEPANAVQSARDYLGNSHRFELKPESQQPRFVLIVDEINRGNISKIFGELITLLEDDKRLGKTNRLRVVLPYSGETFALPPNLYLLGTMNTADKSLALLDVALRRRFSFKELNPDFSVCELPDSTMQQVMEELNRRIMLVLDREHRIGHAFFMGVTTAEEFNAIFADKIVPLLQEYFYNDWDGLRGVLGEKNSGHIVGAMATIDGVRGRNHYGWWHDLNQQKPDFLAVLRKNYGIAAVVSNVAASQAVGSEATESKVVESENETDVASA